MMPGRMLLVVGAVLARCWLAVADPIVSDARIGVFLFGQPAFYSEVAVMVRNNTCLSLDNNMVDGTVNSVLVGGPTPYQVMKRCDRWYCVFYDNYDCAGAEENALVIPAGANNLASAGWGNRVHGIRCVNEPPA